MTAAISTDFRFPFRASGTRRRIGFSIFVQQRDADSLQRNENMYTIEELKNNLENFAKAAEDETLADYAKRNSLQPSVILGWRLDENYAQAVGQLASAHQKKLNRRFKSKKINTWKHLVDFTQGDWVSMAAYSDSHGIPTETFRAWATGPTRAEIRGWLTEEQKSQLAAHQKRSTEKVAALLENYARLGEPFLKQLDRKTKKSFIGYFQGSVTPQAWLLLERSAVRSLLEMGGGNKLKESVAERLIAKFPEIAPQGEDAASFTSVTSPDGSPRSRTAVPASARAATDLRWTPPNSGSVGPSGSTVPDGPPGDRGGEQVLVSGWLADDPVLDLYGPVPDLYGPVSGGPAAGPVPGLYGLADDPVLDLYGPVPGLYGRSVSDDAGPIGTRAVSTAEGFLAGDVTERPAPEPPADGAERSGGPLFGEAEPRAFAGQWPQGRDAQAASMPPLQATGSFSVGVTPASADRPLTGPESCVSAAAALTPGRGTGTTTTPPATHHPHHHTFQSSKALGR
jgi:hypothetical protein